MAKYVTRTIYQSMIKVAKVMFEGEDVKLIDLEPISVAGKLDKDTAMKYVRKAYGKKDTYLIRDVVIDETLYGMPVDDFILKAVPISKEDNE